MSKVKEVHLMNESEFEKYLESIRNADGKVRTATSSGFHITLISETNLLRIIEVLIQGISRSHLVPELIALVSAEIERRHRKRSFRHNLIASLIGGLIAIIAAVVGSLVTYFLTRIK